MAFNDFLRDLPGDRALLPPSQAQCASIVAQLKPASRSSCATRGPTFTNIESKGQLQISIPVPLSILKFLTELRRILEELKNPRRWYRPTFVTIAKHPSYRARDARRNASDLPDDTTKWLAALWRTTSKSVEERDMLVK
jgi:hypothetical protein